MEAAFHEAKTAPIWNGIIVIIISSSSIIIIVIIIIISQHLLMTQVEFLIHNPFISDMLRSMSCCLPFATTHKWTEAFIFLLRWQKINVSLTINFANTL